MRWQKVFLIVVVVVMLLFAALQLNDPDPYIWVPVYLLVAFMAYLKMRGGEERWAYFAPAILYVLWAISLFPEQWEGVLLNEMGMKTINIELARESLGMFINAVLLLLMGAMKNARPDVSH